MKVGGEMNISKYIELLRFYLTDRISEVNNSLNNTLLDELLDIVSNILAAIFSVFISTEFIEVNGWKGVVIKIATVVAGYFGLRWLFSKLLRYGKSSKEISESDNRTLSPSEVKNYIDKFDHVACDGILLSWDFWDKYELTPTEKTSQKNFYLIESFYYYKKSLDIVALIVDHANLCMNNPNNISGISLYRLINVYESLSKISCKMDGVKSKLSDEEFKNKDEFIFEIDSTKSSLKKIGNHIASCKK